MDNRDYKETIAERTAQELKSGEIVNLGIGIPTKVVNYLDDKTEIFLHSENGILGVGPEPSETQINQNLVNAGKQPVTEKTGASFFDSAQSFGMIRGEHVHVAILGALQVDERGQIANWAVPGKTILGVGGAMDLLVGAKRKIVTMRHTTKKGEPKIVKECTFPISGVQPVDKIITELAVFSVIDKHLVLEELLGGASFEEVKEKTEADFTVHDHLKV